MSVSGPSGAAGTGGETARRMRAITSGLTDVGLAACLNETRGVLDITATLERPGGKASEVSLEAEFGRLQPLRPLPTCQDSQAR